MLKENKEKRKVQMRNESGVVIIKAAGGARIALGADPWYRKRKIGGAGFDVAENEFGLYYYDNKSDILNNREGSRALKGLILWRFSICE